MTPEEWFAQTSGTMHAVLLACTSMIATHPEKEKVLALLSALTAQNADTPEESPQTRYYKLGIREAVATIANGVDTAQVAAEIRDLKRSSGTH